MCIFLQAYNHMNLYDVDCDIDVVASSYGADNYGCFYDQI